MRKEKQEFKFETTKAAREVEYLQDDVKERKMRMAMRALRRMEQYHIWRAFSVLKELVAYEHAHGDSVRICFILFFLKLPLYVCGTPVASMCELTLSSSFLYIFVCPNHHIFVFFLGTKSPANGKQYGSAAKRNGNHDSREDGDKKS